MNEPIKKPEDPVERSLANPGGASKFASLSQPKNVRIRPMGWKRGKGRPRKKAPDVRNVHYF